jgi:hypothetical protein
MNSSRHQEVQKKSASSLSFEIFEKSLFFIFPPLIPDKTQFSRLAVLSVL